MLLWKICNGSFFLVGGLTVILISYMIFISQFLDVNMMPISTIFSLPQLDINNKNNILTANLDVTSKTLFVSICLSACMSVRPSISGFYPSFSFISITTILIQHTKEPCTMKLKLSLSSNQPQTSQF